MTVLEKQLTYKPFHYPELVEVAEMSEKMAWNEFEIELMEDVKEWKNGTVKPDEKRLVLEIMKTFTQGDVEVGCGYVDHFLPAFKNTEARMMLTSIAAREGVHMRAYALFADTIGLPEESYSMFLEYEELTSKLEQMTDMDMSTKKGVAMALVRTIASEGVCLYGAFVMLLNFQRFKKLKGLGKINEWSIKDEALHVEGMLRLFKIFIKENPEVVTDELKREIYDMFRNVVELEEYFIRHAFQDCPEGVEGLTPDEVIQYVRYVADRRLIELGLRGNWGVKTNPLPWVDAIISGGTLTNFFEQRVTQYTAGGLIGDWGWED